MPAGASASMSDYLGLDSHQERALQAGYQLPRCRLILCNATQLLPSMQEVVEARLTATRELRRVHHASIYPIRTRLRGELERAEVGLERKEIVIVL